MGGLYSHLDAVPKTNTPYKTINNLTQYGHGQNDRCPSSRISTIDNPSGTSEVVDHRRKATSGITQCTSQAPSKPTAIRTSSTSVSQIANTYKTGTETVTQAIAPKSSDKISSMKGELNGRITGHEIGVNSGLSSMSKVQESNKKQVTNQTILVNKDRSVQSLTTFSSGGDVKVVTKWNVASLPQEEDDCGGDIRGCPACLKPVVEPKLLQCRHVFCLGCLNELFDALDVITCLSCNFITMMPVGGLECLPDYKIKERSNKSTKHASRIGPAPRVTQSDVVSQLVEENKSSQIVNCGSRRSSQGIVGDGNEIGKERHTDRTGRITSVSDTIISGGDAESTNPSCAICQKSNAMVKCIQCSKVMCCACRNYHKKISLNANHTVLKLDKVIKCSQHASDISHVCRSCKKLVCIKCVLTECKNHKCTAVGDAVRSLVRCDGISQKIREIKRTKTAIDQSLIDLGDVKESIDNYAQDMIAAIKRSSEQIKKKIAENQDQIMVNFDKIDMDLLHRLGDISDTDESSLNQGIPIRLMKALPELQVLIDMSSRRVNTDPFVSVRFLPAVDCENFKIGSLHGRNEETSIKQIMYPKPVRHGIGPLWPREDPYPAVNELGRDSKGATRYPIRFRKVVLDYRRGHSALIGLYGDIIVRNDFTHDNDDIKVYKPGDVRYTDHKRLLDSFQPVRVNNLRVQKMITVLKSYAEWHGLSLEQ